MANYIVILGIYNASIQHYLKYPDPTTVNLWNIKYHFDLTSNHESHLTALYSYNACYCDIPNLYARKSEDLPHGQKGIINPYTNIIPCERGQCLETEENFLRQYKPVY